MTTTSGRLCFALYFPPGRTADQYRHVFNHILAWRPEVAPRQLDRMTDADAPGAPEYEPWADTRWPEVAALAAGDQWRSWTLFADDAALGVAHRSASTEVEIVLPPPAEDPFELLVDLIGRLDTHDVPGLAMVFDQESKQDECLIMQGLEELVSVPPAFFLDRETMAEIGDAAKLSAPAQEVRELPGGLALRVRRFYGRLTAEERARAKAMRAALGLPRSFTDKLGLPRSFSRTTGPIEIRTFWLTEAEGRFYGVWAEALDLAWAVGGYGMVARWDGRDWSLIEVDPPAWLWAVTGWEGRAWAVGDLGQIFTGDDTGWSAVESPTNEDLCGVHASARDRVVVVGDRGCIVHWDGRTWARVASGTDRGLYAVSGAGNELWAVGEAGTILRCIDGRWSAVSSPARDDLRAVSVVVPGDVWIAGVHDCVLHYQHGQWRELPTGSGAFLNGILARTSEDVWVVGTEGTICRWNGHAWSAVASETQDELFAVSALNDEDVWAVGEKAHILRTKSR